MTPVSVCGRRRCLSALERRCPAAPPPIHAHLIQRLDPQRQQHRPREHTPTRPAFESAGRPSPDAARRQRVQIPPFAGAQEAARGGTGRDSGRGRCRNDRVRSLRMRRNRHAFRGRTVADEFTPRTITRSRRTGSDRQDGRRAHRARAGDRRGLGRQANRCLAPGPPKRSGRPSRNELVGSRRPRHVAGSAASSECPASYGQLSRPVPSPNRHHPWAGSSPQRRQPQPQTTCPPSWHPPSQPPPGRPPRPVSPSELLAPQTVQPWMGAAGPRLPRSDSLPR